MLKSSLVWRRAAQNPIFLLIQLQLKMFVCNTSFWFLLFPKHGTKCCILQHAWKDLCDKNSSLRCTQNLQDIPVDNTHSQKLH